MFKLSVILSFVILSSCSSQKFFIVRHAEKATNVMSGDPPLTPLGEQQAKSLEGKLHNQKIRHIYSTPFKRNIDTAEPLSRLLNRKIIIYPAANPLQFAEQLKNVRNGNVLVVGHSNTVDDIVNGLTGRKHMTDLPDSAYGHLYIVERKGKNFSFKQSRYVQ